MHQPRLDVHVFWGSVARVHWFFLGFNSAGAAERIHETSEGNDDHAAIYVGGFVSVLYLFESKKVKENQNE